MARSRRLRSTLRRLADVALEDFGVRRSPGRADAPAPVEATPGAPGSPAEAGVPTTAGLPALGPVDTTADAAPSVLTEVIPSVAPAVDLPPGVVWHGAARRSPELQRFCEHLEALRGVS